MGLYSRVKELCKNHQLSIAELEAKLEFGNGSMRRWDKHQPSIDKLLKVADYFDVSTDYLLDHTRTSEIDIQTVLSELISKLSSQNSVSKIKNGGLHVTQNEVELIKFSLEFVIQQAQLISDQSTAKQKMMEQQ